MKRVGVLYVSRKEAKEMEKFCRKAPGWDNCDGKDVPLFDMEYYFDTGYGTDGMRMAIQVCPSTEPDDEPCWTQGVLFAIDGTEMGCTDVGESFLGEYSVEDGEDEYVVDVRIGTKKQLARQEITQLRDRYIVANKDRDLLFTDGKNCYYFPKGWCSEFTVNKGFTGGPDNEEDGPELYGYAPTHTFANSQVETMFVAMSDLDKLRHIGREEAFKLHPRLKAHLDEIDREGDSHDVTAGGTKDLR